MLKKDKERLVEELTDRLRSTQTLIVADYRGLTMSEIDGLRGELLKHGARFSVVKNTLPPVDVLRAQVLGAIAAPLSTIVGLFAAPLRDLVGLIDARIEQLGGAAEAAPEPEAEPEPAAEAEPEVAEAEPEPVAEAEPEPAAEAEPD